MPRGVYQRKRKNVKRVSGLVRLGKLADGGDEHARSDLRCSAHGAGLDDSTYRTWVALARAIEKWSKSNAEKKVAKIGGTTAWEVEIEKQPKPSLSERIMSEGQVYMEVVVPDDGVVLKMLSGPNRVTGTLRIAPEGLMYFPSWKKSKDANGNKNRLLSWDNLRKLMELGLLME